MQNFRNSKQAMKGQQPNNQQQVTKQDDGRQGNARMEKRPEQGPQSEDEDNAQDRVEFQAKSDSTEFLKNQDINECDALVPDPPAVGELICCHVCGKVMRREDFDEDPVISMREFKWQTHNKCMQGMFHLADVKTPGLLAQRGEVREKKVIKNRRVSPW